MKKFTRFLCAIVFLFCLISVAGCSDVFLKGKSAYEIAVDNGFVGSEVEWLESLKGKDGKDGTNGTAGSNGENGKDITAEALFDLAVEYGLYEDNADGYSKFLGDYLTDNVRVKTVQEVASECLNQVVSIYCENSQGVMQAGAGVIYEINTTDNFAYVITNYHVVCCEESDGYAEATSIVLYLYGEETLVEESSNNYDYGVNAIEASYIGGSANYDLAVLKVAGESFEKMVNSGASKVEIADTDTIQPGSTAIAIGNPMGGGTSVTSGIVSVDSEYAIVNIGGKGRQLRCLRIDTPVNGGNSGGGLFDSQGKLIGIVNAKKTNYASTGSSLVVYDNVAYALCGSNVKNAVKNIVDFYEAKVKTAIANGDEVDGINVGVHKFLIGITITSKNPKNVYNSENKTNVIEEDIVVSEITAGGIAESIGFKVGDIVKKFTVTRGEDVVEYSPLRRFELVDDMLNLRAGDSVVYMIERLNVESGEYDTINLEAFVVDYSGFVENKGID